MRWLGGCLSALGAGTAVNSLLGPFAAGVVDYPVSGPLQAQTIGLEAFSLFVVAPLLVALGVLALRNRPIAALLAPGPAGYLTYMLVQYVVGPGYRVYPAVLPLHLGLFVLSGVVLLGSWALAGRVDHPTSRRAGRVGAVVVFGLAAFVLSRYAGLLAGVLHGAPLPAGSRADPGMYWSIVLLDLGVVVPLAIAAGVGLLRRTRWALQALCGVVGWFALVPSSVAAMAIAMLLRGDPNTSTGQVTTLTVAAVVFVGVAGYLLSRLAGRETARR